MNLNIRHDHMPLRSHGKKSSTQQLAELIHLTAHALKSRGHTPEWERMFKSKSTYYSAKSRLKSQGLLIEEMGHNQRPILRLSNNADASIGWAFTPEVRWRSQWDGCWHQLVFDIPEEHRVYRNALRRFLKRLRLGCLQKSVWITPFDIAPIYRDLKKTAIQGMEVLLFEAHAVLEVHSHSIVRQAWRMEKVFKMQNDFCEMCRHQICRLQGPTTLSPRDLLTLKDHAYSSYLDVMQNDPLLPEGLWPEGYKGWDVYRYFQDIITEIVIQL